MLRRIVCSKAGRDRGKFMAVVSEENGFLYLADGKERPLGRPKRKNIKHLALTGAVLDESSLRSDRALRRAIAVYRDSAQQRRS